MTGRLRCAGWDAAGRRCVALRVGVGNLNREAHDGLPPLRRMGRGRVAVCVLHTGMGNLNREAHDGLSPLCRMGRGRVALRCAARRRAERTKGAAAGCLFGGG